MRHTDKILPYLKKKLGSARFKHTLGTTKTAEALALAHGENAENAVLAALLHDMARWMSARQMIAYVKKYKVRVPDLENVVKYNPSLLHGFVGADMARRIFKVKDRSVLEAIALHTLGGPNMCRLAKILYLADITSPDRRHSGVKTIKRLAEKDLDKAMTAASASKIAFVLRKNAWLHPAAARTWNSLIK